jgi:hypothetical protein
MSRRLRDVFEALLWDAFPPDPNRAPTVTPHSGPSALPLPSTSHERSGSPSETAATESQKPAPLERSTEISPPELLPQASRAEQQRFEYRVIVLREGRQGERLLAGAMEAQLNEAGAAGWQLVAIAGQRAILMRQLPA